MHIDKILRDFGFEPTTHAPCLYRANIDGNEVLFLRQVDDFAIGTDDQHIYKSICDCLDALLHEPMKRQGLLTHYNGIDIEQTRDYIHISCETYIDKILSNHGWDNMNKNVFLPMNSNNGHVKTLDTAPPIPKAT